MRYRTAKKILKRILSDPPATRHYSHGQLRAVYWAFGHDVPEEMWRAREAAAPKIKTAPPEPREKFVGYEAMVVPDLKAQCKERGITGYSSMTKSKLIDALRDLD